MATIQNERDKILQATTPRVLPYTIPIDQVEGLPDALENLNNGVKRIRLTSSAVVFVGTTPASTTITATLEGGLTGTIIWSVAAGTATLTGTGNTRTVTAASMTQGGFAVIQASIGTYVATVVLSRLSVLAGQSNVNLATQVTGALASGNVTGLGALALLNTVDLNTQTTGALNGATQVTNLGSLAYANAIAANQIGAGTLAAGVAYIGSLNAAQITAGELRGRLVSTLPSGVSGQSEIQLRPYGVADASYLLFYDDTGLESHRLTAGVALFKTNVAGETPLMVQKTTVGGNAATISASTPVVALSLGTLNTGAPLRLAPQNALPKTANITQGALAMHTTHALCIYDGSNWYKVLVDPTPVA